MEQMLTQMNRMSSEGVNTAARAAPTGPAAHLPPPLPRVPPLDLSTFPGPGGTPPVALAVGSTPSLKFGVSQAVASRPKANAPTGAEWVPSISFATASGGGSGNAPPPGPPFGPPAFTGVQEAPQEVAEEVGVDAVRPRKIKNHPPGPPDGGDDGDDDDDDDDEDDDEEGYGGRGAEMRRLRVLVKKLMVSPAPPNRKKESETIKMSAYPTPASSIIGR